MPIYEYTCLKCNAHTEVLQKITDKPLVRCRKCNGKLEKQWSQTSFQLKGTGWYVTDYAGKKSGDPEKKDADKKDSEKKSDSAEAAKKESASGDTEKPSKPLEAAKSSEAEKPKKSKNSTPAPSSSGD